MYQKIFESTKLVVPESKLDWWDHLFYVPDWDSFLAVASGGLRELARTWRDGTKIRYGLRSGLYEPLGRVNGGLAWWGSWSYKVHPAFAVTALPDENEVLNPGWPITYAHGPTSLTQTFIDDVARLYLHQPNSNRIDVYNLDTGQVAYQINHNTGAYFTVIAWADTGLVACMVKGSGAVRFIDYLYKRGVVEAGRVDPFLVGAYDCQHKNIVTIGADKKVRVYCLETLPAQLSSPQFEPSQVKGLKGNLVKTRLAGQDGEPCRGWWVHWELLGSGSYPPMGYLDKVVSQTDEDGWAYNLYYGPDDGATGQNKIKVSVIY